MGTLSDDIQEYWTARASQDPVAAITGRVTLSDFDRLGRTDAARLLEGLPLSYTQEMVALDIGCGIGRVEKFIASAFREIHLLDVSPEMIRLARFRLNHFPNMKFHVGNGMDIRSISDRSIDLVFSIGTFLHMPRKVADEHFREVFRILREGGLFRFTVTQVLLPIRLFTFARRLRHGNARTALKFDVEGDLSEGRYYTHASLENKLIPRLTGFGFRFHQVKKWPALRIGFLMQDVWVTVSRPKIGARIQQPAS
ncbi:class I SAM-dependent methyltransferase [Candidatus Bathyarchaeota archaeon]|nr:MAG: class I SAM-dependent methyltransferase [Candidatus Bathyarchaeota archaeon]